MKLKLLLSLIITTCYSFAINKKYDFILRKKAKFFQASFSVYEMSEIFEGFINLTFCKVKAIGI